MKSSVLASTSSRIFVSMTVAAAAFTFAPSVQATPLYWDGNGTTAGAGNTIAFLNKVWGTDSVWNSDPLGLTDTFNLTTTAADDLFFVAAPSATSGNVAFNPTVTGTQTANSITFQSQGAQTLSGGTINLGAGGLVGSQYAYGTTARGAVTISSAVALQASQSWVNNATTAMTVSGAISGAGFGITKAGTGSLTLSVANSYSGTTSIHAGTVFTGSATSFGSATSDILLGNTSGASNAGISLGGNNISLSRNITLQSGNTGTMTLSGGAGTSSFTGKLTLGSAGGTGKNVTLSGSGGQNGGGFTGIIADPTGLSGPGGVVTFNQTYNINSFGNANSTFSGGISFNNANSGNNNNFVAFNAGNIFGTGTVTINGLITRQSGGNHITGTNNQIWNGDWTIQGGSGGTLFLDLSGTIDLGSLGSATTNVLNANSATRTIYASGLASIAGNIQNGSNGITKNFSMGTTDPAGWTGGSTLTLSGTNIYTGTTSIRNGTLSIGSIKNVGAGASNVGAPTTVANGTISIGAGPLNGGLLYTGTAQDTDRVINLAGGAGGATLTQSGSGLLKFTSAMTTTGLGSKTLTLQGSTAGTGEIGGAIVDNGTTGSTLLNTTFASGASSITLASVDGVVVGAAISGTGIAGGSTVTAINPTTKVVTLSANTTGAGSSGATITVAGVANLTSVTKAGTGTWTLSGANTYSGNTTVTAGTLKVGVANAIPSGSGKGNLVLNGGASVAGTFDINGLDVGINGLTGTTGAVLGKVVNNATGTSKSLTVGNNDATATFAGVIADNTSGTGTIALIKTGTGTQTLSGTNTYTGATTINGGTLAINGSITSSVTVNDTGTLGGSGTITGDLIVNSGGTHAAGNSPGVETITGSASYLDDSIFAWDLASNLDGDALDGDTGVRGTDYDGVNVSGALSVSSGAIFRVLLTDASVLNAPFWQTAQSWTDIFTAGSTNPAGTGLFDTIQVYNNTTGAAFTPVNGTFTFTGSTLNWSAVPEPSSALAGLLLGAGLLRRNRRAVTAGSSGFHSSRRQG